ncbi:MAG: hypothetical protein KGL39_37215, partial [Patescibacteria group bacterium]|nr:hypothetical protein [Patescibacteria group bacterium]
MITLNGTPLLMEDDDGKVQQWMDRYLPLSEAHAFTPSVATDSLITATSQTIQKRPLGITRLNYPPSPKPKLNTLYWPTGAARWAMGWFLSTADALKDILDQDGPFFSGSATSLPLVLADGTGQFIAADVFSLTPVPISAIDEVNQTPGCHCLYLLPIVDQRFYWQWSNSGALSVTAGSTSWSTVISDLGSALGVTIGADSISGNYLKPDPEELTRPNQNAAVLLDAVAHSLGMRVLAQLNGAIYLQSVGNALGTLNSNFDGEYAAVAGGLGGYSALAASVTTVTRKYTQHRPFGQGDMYAYSNSVNGDNSEPSISGSSRTIFTTAYANFDSGSLSPDNDGNLTDLAQQLTQDYADSLSGGQYDYSMIGAFPWQFNALDDAVTWSVGRSSFTTRIQSMPPNFGADVMLHQDPGLQVVDPIQVGKPYSTAISRGGSGTCHIWAGTPGSETDTSIAIKVYDWSGNGIQLSTKCVFIWDWNDNAWYAVIPGGSVSAVVCPDDGSTSAGQPLSPNS